MRLFPVAFGLALLGIAAILYVYVYYAILSIWGYEKETHWEYALLGVGEFLLASFVAVIAIRILRQR
jgi:hypothetical protein